MTERQIEVRTPDGTSDGFLYIPEAHRRLPGVLFLTDIGGIRPSQREMAQRLAGEGYIVLLPNIFYRFGHPPFFELPLKFDERATKRFGELNASLPPEAFERDASVYLDFMASHPSVASGAVGVVGYCFSGALALRTAALRPGRIAAAASFHGGRLVTEDSQSPHLLLPLIHAQLYFGHAIEDRSMPPQAIEKLNDALKAWGGRYESEVYEGAHHGWTVPDHPSYNRPQAERAFEKLKNLFAKALAQPDRSNANTAV